MGMTTIQIPLLFVGGGNMASAIITGAQKTGVLNTDLLAVLDPNADRRAMFKQGFADAQGAFEWLRDAGGAGGGDFGIVLAVKPQMLSAATEPLRPHIEQSGISPLAISILAGIRSDRIAAAMGGKARVLRVMPNTPAQIGRGMSAIAGSDSSTEPDLYLAQTLMEAVGDVVRIEESMMDAFTAVAGSGPAYVFYLAQAMTKAAQSLGFDPETARQIVTQTITGSAMLLDASPEDAAELRAKVTSKNGTTHAATTTLDELGVMDAFITALAAARDRGEELSRES